MGEEAKVKPPDHIFEGFGPVEDGQHRSGYNVGDLHISREGLQLIYDHMMASNCMPRPLRKDSQVPLAFTTDKENPGVLEVYCGFCKKHLGSCAGGEFRPT